MIDGLKPYEEYKNSGQQWLGDVPAHWDLKPGHAAFTKRKVPNAGLKENTVLSLSYGRIKVKATDKQHGLVPESYETYQIVNPGNIIVRGTDLQNDHTSLRIRLSRNRGVISSAYLCLESRQSITPDYGYEILNTFDLTKAIYRYGSGLRQNLDHGEIKRLPIFLPPLDEQAAIVRFLDHANRKIDDFMRAKRKLIGLLNEQKQAIIQRAVTRGLHPGVPLKSSGIPWLGDIPAHWGVTRSRRLFTVRTELARPDDIQLSSTQAYGVISQSDYEHRIGRRVVKIAMHLEKRRHVEKDDFVISMRSFQGGLERAWVSGAIRSSYVVLKPGPSVGVEFFSYLFKSLGYIRALQATGDFIRDGQDLTFANFRMVDLPQVPSEEQRSIAAFIGRATTELDSALARTEREISLMLEYRTRLTADIVTGKLDVREAAARLPAVPTDPVAEPVVDETLEDDEIEDTSHE